MKPFIAFFRLVVRKGDLIVTDADGVRHAFGDGTGKAVFMQITDPRLHRELALRPSLAIGEGFMAGTLQPTNGTTLIELLTLLMENERRATASGVIGAIGAASRAVGRWRVYNPATRARRNVAHHYDLKDELFDLFLDPDHQYSCAFFAAPTDTLEMAQERKKRILARKLTLAPGQRVLDIGSGWGGLGLFLAKEFGVDVTGLTLSEHQLAKSNARARAAGLADHCRFVLRDYRAERGSYDRIVSVGMFEHVGPKHYETYFKQVHRLLNPDGAALIHSIGAFNCAGPIPSWIDKYIFPGAYVPTLSETTPHIEHANLKLTDIEIWRLHYAETLRHWRQNFMANRDAAKAMYDERFCRMWEFYLTACEVGFRIGDIMVMQMQMARRQDAVPLTRDYLFGAGTLPHERGLREAPRPAAPKSGQAA
jgi:cyclopropane-fatty-acyl-phospholipid synthase